MKAKYIPNILSVIRFLMAIAFAIVFISADETKEYLISAGIFIMAGVTDVVDGYLARHNNWITDLGKIIDPIADKTMQCVSLICLVVKDIVPIWLLIPIVVKELLMGIGSIVYYKKFHNIGVAKNYGKAYTVVFYCVIAAFIVFKFWFDKFWWTWYLKIGLCIVTALVGFVAIILYYRDNLKGKLGKDK